MIRRAPGDPSERRAVRLRLRGADLVRDPPPSRAATSTQGWTTSTCSTTLVPTTTDHLGRAVELKMDIAYQPVGDPLTVRPLAHVDARGLVHPRRQGVLEEIAYARLHRGLRGDLAPVPTAPRNCPPPGPGRRAGGRPRRPGDTPAWTGSRSTPETWASTRGRSSWAAIPLAGVLPWNLAYPGRQPGSRPGWRRCAAHPSRASPSPGPEPGDLPVIGSLRRRRVLTAPYAARPRPLRRGGAAGAGAPVGGVPRRHGARPR